MINLAVFASGCGTNVQRIAEYFTNHQHISVSLILSNKPDAFVLQRAQKLNIPFEVFDRYQYYHTNEINDLLHIKQIHFIILAGFLWLMPENIILAYPNRIINIHPALLPKYGGKGMYGANVHKAVIENKEKESGITIHLVNKQYDKGEILFQATCSIDQLDTAESLAAKIHQLEYLYFPAQIEKQIYKSFTI